MITPKIFSSDAFLNFTCTTVHSSKKSFTFKKISFQRISFDFKFFLKMLKVKVKLLSHVRLFATPWTVAYQASPSMGFFRQEYWIGLPFPSSGDPPDPGLKSGSPGLQVKLYRLSHQGSQYLLSTLHFVNYNFFYHSACFYHKSNLSTQQDIQYFSHSLF